MATINVHISDELLAELQFKAAAQGKTVDELAEAALRKGLEEQSWQELLAYGQERGRASGYTEDDVPRIVKEWQREQIGHTSRIGILLIGVAIGPNTSCFDETV
jgi:hypothetical protein